MLSHDQREGGERERTGRAIGVLYHVLLVALVLGQLIRVPVLASEVKTAPVLGIDVAVCMVWLSVLFRVGLSSSFPHGGWITGLAGLFGAWALIGNILTMVRYDLSLSQLLFSTAYLVRWLFYFGVYIWAMMRFDSVNSLKSGVRLLGAAITVMALFGIVQSAFLPNFAFILHPKAVPYETWDPQGHRLVSTLLDPNLAGDLIGMGILLTLPSAFRRHHFLPMSLLVLLVAAFLAASRGALLGLLTGGFLMMVVLRPPAIGRMAWRLSVVFCFAIAVSSILSWISGAAGVIGAAGEFLRHYNKTGFNDPSALTRLVQWKTDLDVVRTHPLTGIGFNTWGFVQRYFGFYRVDTAAFGMDGGLLVVGALTGIVGVLLFTAMISIPIVRGIRMGRDRTLPDWMRDLGASVAGCTVLWVVHGFFAATLTYPFLLVVVWLLWAWTNRAWEVVSIAQEVDEPSPQP